ncbi:uncharacterized protein M421DRAFT_5067 [Didymella exigua CBS 183.55]|uniref:Uncharacterized protein n=1 Tax=Didymella exigua CBS 183.55 TaxID=1150837 RepID=A0A6A5RN84_9PLEO|nr:uncharacterized protein M421DRAFT_5067 [Didymella exigua CBS 183.55]KAF1928598.1 hypothetical protein M421DRAFT_5067 [Didymella exigua CBS 183.55]
MKLSIALISAFAAVVLALPTPSADSEVAPEVRWDYGSSNEKRDASRPVPRWDYGSTEDKRDHIDINWNYGKKKARWDYGNTEDKRDVVGTDWDYGKRDVEEKRVAWDYGSTEDK